VGRPRPPVADWLAYLGEIGYGEIYRRATGHAAIPEEVAPPVAVPEPSPADAGREEALAELAGRVAVCTACVLSETRNRTVFGTGPLGARLMVIGEGPGAEEDRQGLPFVGRAGELLTKILLAIGLTREEVYIANIVKCRPPGNRAPEPAEVRPASATSSGRSRSSGPPSSSRSARPPLRCSSERTAAWPSCAGRGTSTAVSRSR